MSTVKRSMTRRSGGRACPGSGLRRLGAWMAGLATWLAASAVGAQPPPTPAPGAATEIALPPPRLQGPMPLEQTLAQRRSLRSFAATPLTLAEAGQLLWAAQGISDGKERRTAPSAGATYPLLLYLVAGRVEELPAGVYRYLPQGHRLAPVQQGDLRSPIASAAYFQTWMREAPAYVLISALPARTAARYGQRAAARFVAIESGAAAQNLLLQAVALGLGGTVVGAFNETALRERLSLPAEAEVLAIIPVGRAR